jgi:hypothetical protein
MPIQNNSIYICAMCEQIKKHETMDNINNSNVLHHNGHTFTALIFNELTSRYLFHGHLFTC